MGNHQESPISYQESSGFLASGWAPGTDHIKNSQFTKFEVLSLGCDHVKDFQISEKLETCMDLDVLYGIWATGRSLVTTQ